MYALTVISWWNMKPFYEYMAENDNINNLNAEINNKLSPVIQRDVMLKTMSIFEYLIKKYPAECMDFIKKFADQDEAVQAEYESMENLIKFYSGHTVEFGLAYTKGDYPKTGLNN
jgi:hypothetical protein